MYKRGFTLVEIIVATAIFTVVVTVAIGALTQLNKTSREARAMRVVMDNANSAIDSMARTIRMGVRFDGACDAACNCAGANVDTVGNTPLIDSANPGVTGNICLRFYGPTGSNGSMEDVRYHYNASKKSVERSILGGTWQDMTAPELQVSDMRFYVNGTRLGGTGVEGDQPVVTMLMKGTARVSATSRNFTIQTTITPRTPNLELVKPF